MLFRIPQAVDGVGHILCGHLGSVGKIDIVSQREVPGGVIHLLVAGRRVADDFTTGVGLDQRAVKRGQNAGGDGGVSVSGVKAGDVAAVGPGYGFCLNRF